MSSRAPKICAEIGCAELVHEPGKRKCPTHYKPWANKAFDKRRTDTAARARLRDRVLGRAGYRCQIRKPDRCVVMASDVDRIDNTLGYDDFNCQAACEPCHQWKTSMEGHAAMGHRTSTSGE
jgi:hypothetical protein